MLALDLNLASRPFRNNTLPWVGLIGAVVLLVALSAWNVQTYRYRTDVTVDLLAQQVRLQEELTDLDRRDQNAQREVAKFDVDILAVKADKANEVIRWKAFSWTQLFNRLQDVQPNNVQMLSVYPVFRLEGAQGGVTDVIQDGRIPVSVEGVAKTMRDFFELERRLVHDPHFDRIEPEGTKGEGINGETLFNLKFLYDPRIGASGEPSAADQAQGEAPAEEGGEGGDAQEAPAGPEGDLAADGEPDPVEESQ